MDLIDQSLVFAIILSIGIVISFIPLIPGWVKAITGWINVLAPAWFAWASGLWPFYIITGCMLVTLTIVIAYTTGKAVSDANSQS